jgi:hypothetical protein
MQAGLDISLPPAGWMIQPNTLANLLKKAQMLVLHQDEHTHTLQRWRTILGSVPFLGEDHRLMLHCRTLNEHPPRLYKRGSTASHPSTRNTASSVDTYCMVCSPLLLEVAHLTSSPLSTAAPPSAALHQSVLHLDDLSDARRQLLHQLRCINQSCTLPI